MSNMRWTHTGAGDGAATCASCGREPTDTPAPEQVSGENSVSITVTLSPQNLQQLFSALALSEGVGPTDFLRNFGLPVTTARRMAGGHAVVPAVMARISQKDGITGGDILSLMKAQPLTAPKGPRGPYRPKRGRRPNGDHHLVAEGK